MVQTEEIWPPESTYGSGDLQRPNGAYHWPTSDH